MRPILQLQQLLHACLDECLLVTLKRSNACATTSPACSRSITKAYTHDDTISPMILQLYVRMRGALQTDSGGLQCTGCTEQRLQLSHTHVNYMHLRQRTGRAILSIQRPPNTQWISRDMPCVPDRLRELGRQRHLDLSRAHLCPSTACNIADGSST
jgi:hypothetical protein